MSSELVLTSSVSAPAHALRIATLTGRRLLAFVRDKNDVAVTFSQAPLLAVVFFLVFQTVLTPYPTELFQPLREYATANILLFIATLSAVWFGASKAIVEIPAQLVLYRQERLSFLNAFDFIVSSFIALALIALGQVLLFSASFHALFVAVPAMLSPVRTGLPADSAWYSGLLLGTWLKSAGVLWLTALAAIVTAMLISVFVKTRAAAMAVLTFLMIAQMLLGGSLIQPLKAMNAPVHAAAALSASRWGFEAMLIEFERDLRFAMPAYQKNPGADPFSFMQAAGTQQWLYQKSLPQRLETRLQQTQGAEAFRPLLEAEPLREWRKCLCRAAEFSLQAPLTTDEQAVKRRCHEGREALQPTLPLSPRLVDQVARRGCEIPGMSAEEVRLALPGAAEEVLIALQKNSQLSSLQQRLLDKMRALEPKIALYRQFHRPTVYVSLVLLTLVGLLVAWLTFRWREG